jgi:hypothetical protein
MDLEDLRRSFPDTLAEQASGPASCTPTTGSLGGKPWTMISNGHAMLAIPGKYATQSTFKRLMRALVVDDSWTKRRVSRRALAVWCGPERQDREDPIRPATIFGIRIDQSLVAACICNAEDNVILIHTRGPEDPVVIESTDGDVWMAAVMPLRNEPAFDQESP